MNIETAKIETAPDAFAPIPDEPVRSLGSSHGAASSSTPHGETMTLKTTLIATGLVVTAFFGTAGTRSVAVAGQTQGEETSAKPKQAQPSSGPAAAGTAPAAIEPGHEPIIPPGSKGQPVGTSTRILWAKLNTATANWKLAKEAQASKRDRPERVIAARGEVETLTAEIHSRADDLRDEVELLQAQLEIRNADVQAAEIQKARALDHQRNTGQLIKENAIGPAEGVNFQRDVDLRSAELAKSQAVLNEITLRIKQTTRRRDEAIDLAEKANKLIAEQEALSSAPAAEKR